MNKSESFTPVSSLRGAGDMSLGINQFDAIAAQMYRTYPDQWEKIAQTEQMVEELVIEPAIGALILRSIEEKTPLV